MIRMSIRTSVLERVVGRHVAVENGSGHVMYPRIECGGLRGTLAFLASPRHEQTRGRGGACSSHRAPLQANAAWPMSTGTSECFTSSDRGRVSVKRCSG